MRVALLLLGALLPLLRVPMEVGIGGGRLAALRIVASCVLPFAASLTAQALAPPLTRLSALRDRELLLRPLLAEAPDGPR